MPDLETLAKRHDSILDRLGFVPGDRIGVKVIRHPDNEKVQLLAVSATEGHLDLFTQFGSSPLNTIGDPLNICIRIPDHDEAFVEAVVPNVVAHFLSLSV